MAKRAVAEICGPFQFPDLTQYAQSGVYFLHLGDKIVYVGQAVDMRRRIGQHIGEGTKPFDSISFIACPIDQLGSWERLYIERLRPEYNRCRLSNFHRMVHPDRPQPTIAEATKKRTRLRRRRICAVA